MRQFTFLSPPRPPSQIKPLNSCVYYTYGTSIQVSHTPTAQQLLLASGSPTRQCRSKSTSRFWKGF